MPYNRRFQDRCAYHQHARNVVLKSPAGIQGPISSRATGSKLIHSRIGEQQGWIVVEVQAELEGTILWPLDSKKDK